MYSTAYFKITISLLGLPFSKEASLAPLVECMSREFRGMDCKVARGYLRTQLQCSERGIMQ